MAISLFSKSKETTSNKCHVCSKELSRVLNLPDWLSALILTFARLGPSSICSCELKAVADLPDGFVTPYQEYLDQDPPPSLRSIKSDSTPQLATDDPTDTKSAYYQLGIKAAKVLDELVLHPGTKPDVGILTWNGSDWGP